MPIENTQPKFVSNNINIDDIHGTEIPLLNPDKTLSGYKEEKQKE